MIKIQVIYKKTNGTPKKVYKKNTKVAKERHCINNLKSEKSFSQGNICKPSI